MPLDDSVWYQCDWNTARREESYVSQLHHLETEERVERALKRGSFELDGILQALSAGMRQVVADLPDIYQRCWVDAGNVVSPEFLRELLSRVILPTIQDELEWSQIVLLDLSRRSDVPLPSDYDSALSRIKVFAKYYAAYWREKTELTAKALARRKPRRGRPPVSSPERKALKQAVLRARDELTRADLDPRSTKAIVGILAKDGTAPIPKSWRSKYGVKSWAQVHSKPELMKRAAKIFTKIKTASP